MPFPITCTACQKTFSIADDVYERKVKGRVVTIKCKQCQAGIRVDGTKDTLVISASDSVRPPDAASAAPPLAAPVAPPEPAPVAAPAPAAPFTSAMKAQTLPSAPAAKAAPKGLGALGPRAPAAPLGSATQTPVAAGPKVAATAPKMHAPLAPRAPLAAAKGALSTTVKASPAALAPKAPPAAPALPPAPAPVVAAPAPAAPAGETLWAVDYPDGQDRELTVAEIAKELASGAISLTSLVWREGMGEWLELGQVAELKGITAPAKPPPIPDPPAQRPRAPSAPAIDLPKLGGLAKPRPPAPSVPVIDFALHEAISSAPPPAPKPRSPTIAGIGALPMPPPAPPPPAPPPPPLAPIAAPAPAFPEAPVMVPAPALAAPFAATAQATFGRPSPTPVGATAPVANIPDWPQKKSRMPLIIGGVVLLAVAAGAFFVVGSADDKLPPPVPISALPAAAPTTPRTVAAQPQTTADRPSSASEGQGSRAAIEPSSGSPTATPNAGFAELFASGARHADDKKGAGPTQRFDPNAAKSALAAAAFETPKCREKGGPSGKATLVVTFEPSGKVASATVSDPPFAGTSSGACIAAAMKKATVPAFSGLPGTVTKIISIQ